MEEDIKLYVNPRQADNLKYLGFDFKCRAVWHYNGTGYRFIPDYGATFTHPKDIPHWNTSENWGKHIYSAPTLYDAARWLRESLGVDLVVSPKFNSSTGERKGYFCYWSQRTDVDLRDKVLPTYEEALSAGLDAVLSQFFPTIYQNRKDSPDWDSLQ